jgi:hypothetical protein
MIACVLVALLLLIGPLACLAGDSYLNRSKVREAAPYGTTIEPPPAERKAAPAAGPDRDAGRPTGMTSTTVVPESMRGDRDRGPDRR